MSGDDLGLWKATLQPNGTVTIPAEVLTAWEVMGKRTKLYLTKDDQGRIIVMPAKFFRVEVDGLEELE